MKMYSFKNDYSDGGHPRILKALTESCLIRTEGYGDDEYCAEAVSLLKEKIGSQDIDIHFISGGTLTNLVALSAFLRPHEAVISAVSGHIYVHETGSIEATGHKVFPVVTEDGKIRPEQVRQVAAEHHFEHMVKPKLLYISQSTEIGTLYSRREVEALRKVCDELGLYLYIDGARLGSALMSSQNDLSLCDIREMADAFYIGGTKNGALFGEALVICNDSLKKEFRYLMKQRGAILAKGRLLGAQFQTLFEDDLFFQLAEHANNMAGKLQKAIMDLGYELQFYSVTNQIFPIFPENILSELEKSYAFYRWNRMGDGSFSIRLICSWDTEETSVDAFVEDLKKISL